jgi:DNA-binding transcriptional LysR family regulator
MAIDRMKDINVFVHVAEAKSFTAAAERIGLSRSAVGKSIVRLEDRLGVRLLQRTTRSVSLTGEGAAFHERCVRLLADLDEAEMAMLSHSQAPRGRLRLDLPVSFGRLHVLPILNSFMHKWPEISVSASFNDRYVDLIDEGVDLAIRIGGSEDGRLMSRLLAPHRLVTCASPAYFAGRSMPQNIEQLAQHSCLAFVHGGRPVEWRFSEYGQYRSVAISGRFAATNAEALRDATLAGYGIARLATFLISDDLRAGRLLPILQNVDADGPPIRAVYPSSRHLSPKVRTFIDELLEAWRPEPPWDNFDAEFRRGREEKATTDTSTATQYASSAHEQLRHLRRHSTTANSS